MLYPYRASSPKNQVRWQWGVLMPDDVVALDPRSGRATGPTWSSTGGRPALQVTVRFLQVQRRDVERRVAGGLRGGPARCRRRDHVAVGRGTRARARLDVPRRQVRRPDLRRSPAAARPRSCATSGASSAGWCAPGSRCGSGVVDDGRAARSRRTRVTLVTLGSRTGPPTAASRAPTGPRGCAGRWWPPTCSSRSTGRRSSPLLDPPEWASGYVDGVRERRASSRCWRAGRADTRSC